MDEILHASLPWDDAGPLETNSDTCRYCGMPVKKKGNVTCEEHKGYYIQLRKKVKRQVARLLKLARERAKV